MVIAIVQVMNNTSKTLHYYNHETQRSLEVKQKTQQYEKRGWIPSSSFHHDQVPYRCSGFHIDIWLGDAGPRAEIQDDDWKFRIAGPVSYSRKKIVDRYGSLISDGHYILRVDEVRDGRVRNAAFTFLEYRHEFKSVDGHVASRTIQQAAVVVGLVLLTIFL